MKRILRLVSLLVVVTGCSLLKVKETPPNSNKAPEVKTTPEAKNSPAVAEAEITAKEKSAWEALEKKNYDAFSDMLAADYVEVTGDAVFDKAGSVKTVKDLTVSDASFSDWKVLPIDKDAAVVIYTATIKGAYKGQPIPATTTRASSAWVNRAGKWLLVYHQESQVNQLPAPPPPAGMKTPASAMGKPAETSVDPIANEKIVWENFKGRNYEAFGALLVPEFVEVESTGVYDKAGAVKSAGEFDASPVQLSDWKAAKLADNAALVTYLIKVPGAKPAQERHSTIWINRGGKWLALLHQGTPAGK